MAPPWSQFISLSRLRIQIIVREIPFWAIVAMMIIFAVTNGFIDDVPVPSVREWEKGFHAYMAANYPQVGEGIRTGKTLTKEIEADLRRGIEAYKKTTLPAKPAGITKADL